jgi:hypothetical protein
LFRLVSHIVFYSLRPLSGFFLCFPRPPPFHLFVSSFLGDK